MNVFDDTIQVSLRRVRATLEKNSSAVRWFEEEIREIPPTSLRALVEATPIPMVVTS